jgi:hypothetical protein
MLTTAPMQRLSDLYEHLGAALDLTAELYEDAVVKYEDVAEWLNAPESPLHAYDALLYPQGSFRLGTVVRPLFRADEYDLDFVCRLTRDKTAITQEQLKNLVGDRLKKHPDLKVSASRRCWTIDYPKQFHMDVLPAIVNTDRPPNGILLTDRELRYWQFSNPIDYATWFFSRMASVVEAARKRFAASAGIPPEEVPLWQIKTALQRCVQLLKRHRDIYFAKNGDLRTPSILITTLAAHAYDGSADIAAALHHILSNMHRFINKRDDKWEVTNPTDQRENFADKWNEKPALRTAFLQWLDRARDDFSRLQQMPLQEGLVAARSMLGNEVDVAAAVLGMSAPVLNRSVTVPSVEPAPHAQLLRWPERRMYNASITTDVYTKSGKKLWRLSDRSVPKNVELRFRLNTNVPSPYSVQWQVVNTGAEARANGDLRGDFYGSDLGNINRHTEQTKYRGTHWIEAFVVRNGEVVARTGRTLVKIR